MNRRTTSGVAGFVLALIVVCVASGLRVAHLSDARVHGDEAVQAFKSWHFDEYRYNPHEFHGPTLAILTQPALMIASNDGWGELSILPFRATVVTFSLLTLVALLLLFPRYFGTTETLLGVAVLALSPLMVHFSRVYIHESLLFGFSMLFLYSLWGWAREHRLRWALRTGSFAALMWCSKETALLALAAAAMTALSMRCWPPRNSPTAFDASSDASSDTSSPPRTWLSGFALPFVASAVAVTALLITRFWADPGALVDAVTTVAHYTDRARLATEHHHPFYFYLARLSYFQHGSGPIFSEGAILILGLWGGVKSRLPAHVALARYTLLVTLFYSALPYKTPWCAIQFHGCWCLLAGVGSYQLWNSFPHRVSRVLCALPLIAVATHLSWQSWQIASRFNDDPRSPHLYAEPLSGVERLEAWLPQLRSAAAEPGGEPIVVAVIHPNPWPLPWYLRRLTKVGYWDGPQQFLEDTQQPPSVVIFGVELKEWFSSYGVESERRFAHFHYGLRRGETLIVAVDEALYERFVEASQR